MTATSPPVRPGSAPAKGPGSVSGAMPGSAPHRGEFLDVVRSEWIKLRSVRSTYWSLASAIVVIVGLSAAIPAAFAHNASQNDLVTTDLVALTLTGVYIGQLIVGVLGVLVITSEYSTGMIRTTLAAVPGRRRMLAAKVCVFAVTIFVATTATTFAAFALGTTLLHRVADVSLSDPGALRAVIGAGLYLTLVGLFGIGLGTIIRHTAGAISALVGIMLVLIIIVATLPSSLRDHVWKYLPGNAGESVFLTRFTDNDHMKPWNGFALFCLYVAVSLIIGTVLLTRRDA